MKLYKKIILALLLLIFVDKAIAQSINKTSEPRVIYEQQMSYDAARQMKAAVEKMEKEKEGEEMNPEQLNPILGDLSNDSDQNSSDMAEMLKNLLKSMGIDLPNDLAEEQGGVEADKSKQKGDGNFKTWDERHNWKGIRTEQK